MPKKTPRRSAELPWTSGKMPRNLRELIKQLEKGSLKGGSKRVFREAMSWEQMDYADETTIDLNFSMGHPIFRGIPWEKYTELEIQTILKIHFESQGYDVIWRHFLDAANEESIDLECSKPSNGERLLVAVKKNPKKDDLGQLLELSNHKADRRVYAHVGGASQSFRDQSARFQGSIEFWTEARLEQELNSTGVTVRMKIANTPANESMFKIMSVIMRNIADRKGPDPTFKVNPDLMETLWGMKDRAVTVNQCLRMAQLMFENEGNFSELSDSQVHNLVVFILDFLYAYGLVSLRNGFNRLSSDLQSLIYLVHKKTFIRSNWLMLYAYRPGLMPGWVAKAYEDYEKEKAEWKGLDVLKGASGKNEMLEPKMTNVHDAANIFRGMASWAYGLEATIDDLYTKCVRGDVRE